MASLDIVLEGDGAFRDLDPAKAIEVQHFALTALEGGMTSGRPSVAVIVRLDDGRWVFAETSMRLLFSAVDLFKAKYGDPRVETSGEPA